MNQSQGIYPAIFDSITEHIAVLDEVGTIQRVNKAWEHFATENGGSMPDGGIGANYLEVCDSSSKNGNRDARLVADGLRGLIDGRTTDFFLDYSCHSPSEKRWFMIKVWPLSWEERRYTIVCHQNITKATVLKKHLLSQSLTDSLTGLANRRHFDKFLNQEWRRHMRTRTPLSIIMLDIDYFKLFNDRYGHIAGDECLKNIASLISTITKRPGDLAARYGGEEFTMILGNTPLKAATQIAHTLCTSIEGLKIRNEDSSVSSNVTASLGVTTIFPTQGLTESALVSLADQALYTAKNTGRNKVSLSNIHFI